jgi:hypothetical protein
MTQPPERDTDPAPPIHEPMPGDLDQAITELKARESEYLSTIRRLETELATARAERR